MELKDEADFVEPEFAQIAAQPTIIIDKFSIQRHLTFRRIDDAADNVKQRGLTGPRGPEQCVDPGIALAKVLGDAGDLDQGRAWAVHCAIPRLPWPDRPSGQRAHQDRWQRYRLR